jgi:MFS superfamily sulfate permease-like transporter
MYYANNQQLSAEISDIVNSARPSVRWFCIDASAVDDVDFSAAEALRSIFVSLKGKGIRLVIIRVMADVTAELRHNLRQLFGDDAFYNTLDDLMEAYGRQPPDPKVQNFRSVS